jgi:hypothetical protein
MGTQKSRTSNSQSDHPRKTSWLEEIPLAGKLAGLAVVVIATFFGTRSTLQSDIADLRRRMPLTEYSQRALINEQITNLKLLERELARIEKFVSQFREGNFRYAMAGTPAALGAIGVRNPGTLPYQPVPEEVLIGTTDNTPLPEQFSVEAFTSVLFTQATRSIPAQHASLVADLYTVHLAISDYNHRYHEVDASLRVSGPNFRARLQVGTPKRMADPFGKTAAQDIKTIRDLLPSLKERLAQARQDVEKQLSAPGDG